MNTLTGFTHTSQGVSHHIEHNSGTVARLTHTHTHTWMSEWLAKGRPWCTYDVHVHVHMMYDVRTEDWAGLRLGWAEGVYVCVCLCMCTCACVWGDSTWTQHTRNRKDSKGQAEFAVVSFYTVLRSSSAALNVDKHYALFHFIVSFPKEPDDSCPKIMLLI